MSTPDAEADRGSQISEPVRGRSFVRITGRAGRGSARTRWGGDGPGPQRQCEAGGHRSRPASDYTSRHWWTACRALRAGYELGGVNLNRRRARTLWGITPFGRFSAKRWRLCSQARLAGGVPRGRQVFCVQRQPVRHGLAWWCPLISLMKDQVDTRWATALPRVLKRSLAPPRKKRGVEGPARGRYRLLYVSPERLGGRRRRQLHRASRRLGVSSSRDDAHGISQWGHDSGDTALSRVRELLPETSVPRTPHRDGQVSRDIAPQGLAIDRIVGSSIVRTVVPRAAGGGLKRKLLESWRGTGKRRQSTAHRGGGDPWRRADR